MKLSLKAKIIAGLGVLAALCVFGFMTVKLISAQPTGAKYEKFYEASEGVSAEFQKAADLPYSDLGDGLRFVMTDYTEVTFNKTIDLSDPEVKKSFIEFYVIPEVDGEVTVGCPEGRPLPEPGSFVDVRVTGADEYDLTAELL